MNARINGANECKGGALHSPKGKNGNYGFVTDDEKRGAINGI